MPAASAVPALEVLPRLGSRGRPGSRVADGVAEQQVPEPTLDQQAAVSLEVFASGVKRRGGASASVAARAPGPWTRGTDVECLAVPAVPLRLRRWPGRSCAAGHALPAAPDETARQHLKRYADGPAPQRPAPQRVHPTRAGRPARCGTIRAASPRPATRRAPHSSRGPGHRPLKAEIIGSNPICGTKFRIRAQNGLAERSGHPSGHPFAVALNLAPCSEPRASFRIPRLFRIRGSAEVALPRWPSASRSSGTTTRILGESRWRVASPVPLLPLFGGLGCCSAPMLSTRVSVASRAPRRLVAETRVDASVLLDQVAACRSPSVVLMGATSFGGLLRQGADPNKRCIAAPRRHDSSRAGLGHPGSGATISEGAKQVGAELASRWLGAS